MNLTGIITLVIGLLYTFKTISLPKATIGNSNAPMIFPLMIGVLVIVLGIIQLLKDYNDIKTNGKKEKQKDENLRMILLTSLIIIVYALIFESLGYIISTSLFIFAISYLFNGKENLKRSIFVSVLFSISIYVVFSKFLGVILPMIPFIYI